MFERITKKESKCARQRADEILSFVREDVRDRYIFESRLVGSAKWGTCVSDGKGEFDVDYQIVLSRNSSNFKDKPSIIKRQFLKSFNKFRFPYENIQDSTTAITLINKKGQKFHIDFVIIKDISNPVKIIRRNNTKERPSINSYTWNQLPNINKAYVLFSKLDPDLKKDLIDNYIIPAKQKEKQKSENDVTKISSCEVFVREINNYLNKIH